MRTAKIEIGGIEHTLCFSARVMRTCVERYGDLSSINKVLSADRTPSDKAAAIDEAMWLLAQMMDAGARYERLNGRDTPPPLSYDDLYDSMDVPDLSMLKKKVVETINAGQEQAVFARPEKNTGATQAAAAH